MQRQGDKSYLGVALANLAYNYLMLGMFGRALANLERALKLAEDSQSRRMCAYNRLNISLALWRMDRLESALQSVESAIAELQAIQDTFGVATGEAYRGLMLERTGDILAAQAAYARAESSLREMSIPGYADDALCGLARCALAQGQLEEARRLAGQICANLSQGGAQGMELPGMAFLTCAQVYSALHDPENVRNVVNRGAEEITRRANQISDPDWRASFLDNLPEHRALLAWQARLILSNLDGEAPSGIYPQSGG